MTFFRLAAFSVPTRASNRLAHRSSLNRTPNFTLILPSASVEDREGGGGGERKRKKEGGRGVRVR